MAEFSMCPVFPYKLNGVISRSLENWEQGNGKSKVAILDDRVLPFCDVSQDASSFKFENNIKMSFPSNEPLNCRQQCCPGYAMCLAIYSKADYKAKPVLFFSCFYLFSNNSSLI